VGEGASFHVRLPVTPPPEAALLAPPRRAPSATATLTGRHVLLVDDERDTRELVVEVLAGAGATVTPAASASDARGLLENSRFDLLVSDIAMPGEDGYDLVRWLREHGTHRRLPALALSAYARSEDRQRALRAGFDGYLSKPVAPVELLAAAAAVLAPPRRPSQDAHRPGKGRRVLVVENDAAAREALTALLERRGHRVTAAESGVEGVEKAAALRPDVAIVDLGLPDLDGLEVARRLRAGSSASATLVAVTGRTVDSDVEAALAAGFDAHLPKPLDLERLYELIDAAALAQ
jgi:CheY-like chemotaxis protein